MPSEPQVVEGVLEFVEKGYGFLRNPARGLQANPMDPFVSLELIRQFRLREGVHIRGELGPPNRPKGGPPVVKIHAICGQPPEKWAEVKSFDKLTPINPNQRIKFETTPDIVTMRVVDLLTPIGKGQRALIVSPPRSGKTTLLQQMAAAVATNHPEIYLIVLLIDERPEEVTDWKRSVKGEVIASSNDMPLENHVRVSRLAAEIAKRRVEMGQDVFLVLDSITRMGRAFNAQMGNSGRTMTGGLDSRALEIPKRVFGAARNAEEGGSLTTVASALIETGSRMDEFIFQEFKGTGNMELVLNRKLAEQRIWPAMDIAQSGTRKEELLIPPADLERIAFLRRGIIGMAPDAAMSGLLTALAKTKSNKEFLASLAKGARW
ncbi:MAG: transcription termination factor Rho [Verrucomicrobiae bacterium]|nr:transcription termination factor Rho [Verrucomicrobiae bacterium]